MTTAELLGIAATVTYITSALMLCVPIILSTFSSKISKFTGVDSWDDVIGGITLSCIPIFNTVFLLAILSEYLPKLPRPKHWRD